MNLLTAIQTTSLFTVLVAIVLGTLLAFYISRNLHEQAMADKGYIEQALPGTTNTIWVKDSDAIKAVLLATSILLLSGCGIYDRQTIKFECDKKDNIVVYVYKAQLVSADENITQAKFLVRTKTY